MTENTFGIVASFANAFVGNNIVTGNSASAFSISNSNTIVNQNNLFFDNGNDFLGTVAGPNTVFADPLYIDTQAFRPRSNSPVVDAGDDTLLPAGITTDLDGDPRVDGTVDIGAYEVPEPSAALASAAALLGLSIRRRLGRHEGRTLPHRPARRPVCP